MPTRKKERNYLREITLTNTRRWFRYWCKIIDTIDCESTLNPEGQGEALPATDRETCSRGREGLVTQAVVAISARDMSDGAVVGDHPQ